MGDLFEKYSLDFENEMNSFLDFGRKIKLRIFVKFK
jgi:hypothetical protein